MKFIKTHDGKVGWDTENGTRWFDNEYQAKMWGAASYDFDMSEVKEFMKEFDRMMEQLSKTGHPYAYFGCFGSFIYSEPESF